MGPLLTACRDGACLLLAYEHGSQSNDPFLHYVPAADRRVTLQSVKGHCFDGQPVTAKAGLDTVWMHLAVSAGSCDDLAAAYRRFILLHQSPNRESRRPYIFYNTWANQEREKWRRGGKYLDPMTEPRILQDIDTAAAMGIDVFVIDTGWYDRTGDWRINRTFFPNGLDPIRRRLEEHGMKLGLWFSPRQVALSSSFARDFADCRMSWQGRPDPAHEVWETEESFCMCLVSRYWEAFADELIRLHRETGVTYFKWDAVDQYGCDSPDHFHGTTANTPQERADCYAFELVRYMGRIVDRLCEACPEAIVDFDITEGNRCVGLGFLASGKYFLINNGPYFHDLDHPRDDTRWSNVFVHPGPARPTLCRTTLAFDKWIPSVLFLTHYLPDEPAESQMINIASLVLGHNGIWGDLDAVSKEGVERFGRWLNVYKQIRDDLTLASPVRSGPVGGCPEVHEKINPAGGRGAIVMFASHAGTYEYISQHATSELCTTMPGLNVTRLADGRAKLTFHADGPSGRVAFFGTGVDIERQTGISN
jgi:alpha-galactosidase